ncbi:5-methyltetrahydropteroyltriglutamate--homocysteine S-methyltransferase [Halobacillus karajensis]|uniref:5-methyltetrahydropteroyltriglutamate--homocysteine methyltransferase n=1 Tax=Halobacillus karajensis TaxID=195088 RepID=A0A059NXD5_9BACI|nr:5-methyltetrahydropteroyltriglutamate--homocysteine S-methyltransferase [Halobacillus karajensis]CDQ18488.1 5-methyltetrahydropteroyltriglutamate--homocysteine methyltransferase [Halobacillus karajensis]CDQ23440.1 5-methyltetrahydropteroyltriglutamate--homocysteine methyltransferase [Halobacillus karajensis]CDQ26922.1 5-methyltetrahydropteroyltriglutamate--homocysteine methyltransferase [Halobacillus karajensis]
MSVVTEKNVKRAPFKGDHVGSFLRPERLKAARNKRAKGEITEQELRQVEDEEIVKLVEKQKESGLKAVTDGDFRRSWWHFDFLEGLDGVEGYEAESGLKFDGVETKARGIKITGKVGFTDHVMVEHFRFLKRIAGDAVAKLTIPSPNMLLFRAKREEGIYESDEALVEDLVEAYQGFIEKIYEEGCRYLQLDDTSWATFFSEEGRASIEEKGQNPEKAAELCARTVNESIANRPEDMLVTMHICRGNFRSTFMASGSYEALSETIFGGLDVDGLFLEFDDERSGGFEPLRHVNRTDLFVVLGLITSKFGELEDPERVKARIREASDYVPLEQLCLSPQCGFASTEEGNEITEDQQWEKVRHVLSIAEDVWQEG